MNEIPSVLQSILRKRYLNEAVTMAPQVSYTKKEEEEEPFPSPRLAPTSPTVQPELKLPAASEFPSPEITKPETSSKISTAIQRALRAYPTSPEYFGDPDDPLSGKRRLETSLEASRRIEQRRERGSSRSDTKMYSGIPPIPEEQISRAAQATKSGVEKAIAGAKKFDAYATQKAPYTWPTIKDLPKHGMYFGASIPVFDAFYKAAKQHTPFEPGLGGMDPYSFGAGTVGTSATIPFALETAHALGRGFGLAGALGQGLGAAGGALASGWTIIPPLVYAAAYGMSKAEEAAEPYRKEKAKEIDAYLDYEKTKRRLEGRKPSFWERYSEEELERSKFNPLGAADWGR